MAMTRAAACGLAVLLAGFASADAQVAVNMNLMTITALECTFSASVAATWKGGEAGGVVRATEPLSLKYDGIDTRDMIVHLAGSPEELVLQASSTNMHILEVLESSVAITSVFSQPTKDGRLKAVHTRTETLQDARGAAEPTVIQYYGDCAATR